MRVRGAHADMSDLILLHSPAHSANDLHVVFVHGLNPTGSADHYSSTWMAAADDEATLWPKWLGEEAGVGIWLFRYDAHASGWTGRAMAHVDQGHGLLNALQTTPALQGKRLVLVGHSMGGLVIKHALVHPANTSDTRFSGFINQVKAVAFLATPHKGSALAVWAKHLRWVAISTPALGGLVRNDDDLQNLNTRFVQCYKNLRLKALVFVETYPSQFRLLGSKWLACSVIVVDRSSSDPVFDDVHAIPIEADHAQVAQRGDKAQGVYPTLLQMINGLKAPPASATVQAPPLANSIQQPAAKPAEPAPSALLPFTTEPAFWGHAEHLRWAKHRQQKLLDADQELLNGRFVNLTLLPASSDDAQGQPVKVESLAALLTQWANEKAWVLAGDPGGGKSTLLRAHELETLAPWLADGAAAPASSTELCVAVELRRLHAAGVPAVAEDAPAWVDAWLQKQWQRLCWDAGLGNPPTLAEMRSRCRVRLLLDGLNEIDAADEAQRARAVVALSDWLAQAPPRPQAAWLAPVFTVRVLNYSQTLSSADVPVRRAEVRALDAGQIKEFCQLAFAGDEENPVWLAIKDDPELEDFFGNPFNLRLQCTLHGALQRVVRQRADLLAARTWARLLDLTQNNRFEFAPTGATAVLLTPADRVAINNAPEWRKPRNLWHLPEGGEFIRGLDAWAYDMHMRNSGAPGEATEDQACAHVAVATRAAWWRAVLAFDVVTLDHGRYKFKHHLHQEFFAARHLARLPEPSTWPSLRAPALDKREVARWESLPLPPVSRWDQATRMAVQMRGDPVPLLRRMLEEGNLPLAARACAAMGAEDERVVSTAEAALRLDIQHDLIARSQNPAVSLRERLEASLALGDMGDRVRYREHRSNDGVTCLLPVDSCWVPVPAGHYPMGEPSGVLRRMATAHIQHSFKLAFAPVTNAEFAKFVVAQGYARGESDEPPTWWGTTSAVRDFWRGQGRDGSWAEVLDAWRNDAPEVFERDCLRLRVPPGTRAWFERLRALPLVDYEREREETVAIKQPPREPGWWRSANFNNGLQPVVGVSLYEAQAYVAWLNHLRPWPGQRFMLPTCAQWEAAARGATGREWPWGSAKPSDAQPRMNDSRDGRVGRTSPVAMWRDGATPDGLYDMAGQVWEWSASAYLGDGTDVDQMIRSAPPDVEKHAVRGGSWNDASQYCRPAIRSRNHPDDRNGNLGLRLLVCPIQNPVP
jgi:formylglycine-generating enzyme required for sulfatase activity